MEFEYKVISKTKLDGIEDILNMYSNDGWELVGYSSDAVHVMSVIRNYNFILKRKKK